MYIKTERLDYIDTIKGFAMVLVLLGHTYSSNNVLITWINSFHMPLFFIITGYLISYKEITYGRVKFIFGKKLRNLLLPYFIFGFLLSLYYSVLTFISEGYFFNALINKFTLILTLKGIGPLWFLPCLFLAEFIFIILLDNIGRVKTSILIIILFTISVSLCKGINTEQYLIGCRIFIASSFINFGYLFYRITNNIDISWIIIIIMNISTFMISICNGTVGIVNLTLNNIYMYMYCSIVGSLGIIFLFKKVSNARNKKLRYIGTNSIVVLCTQSFIINTVRLIDYKVFGSMLPKMGIFEGLIFTIIILIITFPIISVINNKFVFLIGKTNKQRDLQNI